MDFPHFKDMEVFGRIASGGIGKTGEDAVAEVREFGAMGLSDSGSFLSYV
jgi:hypothetical protein